MRAEIDNTPPGSWFGLALGLLVISMMTVSPLALIELGFAYDEAGGNALEKIHPATMLAAVLLLAAGAHAGNPIPWLLANATESRSLLPYLAVIVLLIVFSMRVVHLPFTHFFDTFVLPVMIYLLFKDMREERGRNLARLVHLLMMVNAGIGVFEFASGLRLTPIVAGGIVIEDDWRSTALLGHPLANASLTGCYLLLLSLGGGRDLPASLRLVAFLLNAAGMVVFGGRAATVLLIVLLVLLALTRLADILRGGRFSPVSVLKGLILVPVSALIMVVAAEAGFFDRFISRFFDDKGSAETRAEMFELFNHIPFSELLLAPDARQIETLQFHYGLDFGIESFWISFVLSYGLVASLVFFAALLAFSIDVIRRIGAGSPWAFVFFYGVASTSVSLSAKSPLLGIFTLMLLVLLRLPRRATAPAVARVPSRRRRPALRHATRSA
jgi:hypothetical protein